MALGQLGAVFCFWARGTPLVALSDSVANWQDKTPASVEAGQGRNFSDRNGTGLSEAPAL
jgi:hypothetical protein